MMLFNNGRFRHHASLLDDALKGNIMGNVKCAIIAEGILDIFYRD